MYEKIFVILWGKKGFLFVTSGIHQDKQRLLDDLTMSGLNQTLLHRFILIL